jgi:hypothetical protein
MSLKRRMMAEQWNSFAESVLPPNVGPVQRQEMRRAFYAGGQAIMLKIIQSLAPETEPTASDLRLMDDLHEELNSFAEAVRMGLA